MPYTVTNVDNKQIEASGRQQLLSALSGSVPGLFITERNILGFGLSNGGAGGIKIRGVGGSPTNAVLMMVDGQPQFAGIYSHHVADFYETEYVDHVEVLRGPGSVLYGSNAMGGVINVITKEADSEGIRTTARTQYGSYNTWCSSVTSTTHYGKLSSLISASYDRTDGIEKKLLAEYDIPFFTIHGGGVLFAGEQAGIHPGNPNSVTAVYIQKGNHFLVGFSD